MLHAGSTRVKLVKHQDNVRIIYKRDNLHVFLLFHFQIIVVDL